MILGVQGLQISVRPCSLLSKTSLVISKLLFYSVQGMQHLCRPCTQMPSIKCGFGKQRQSFAGYSTTQKFQKLSSVDVYRTLSFFVRYSMSSSSPQLT